MRADRLVSLVLLLRQHGRLPRDALARELEVSTRTVLRDIDALSAAGVPVYAERGRHGGFALLPGFRTELTGLNHDEALALLVAGARRGAQVFGLGSALASAMLKVVDALPEGHRATAAGAAQRLLVDPETDLLSRRLVAEELPDTDDAAVRRAVVAGHRLRIHYAASGPAAAVAHGRPDRPGHRPRPGLPAGHPGRRGPHLPARPGAGRRGTARTRASARTGSTWTAPGRNAARSSAPAATRSPSLLRVDPARREELVGTALAVLAEAPEPDGWLRLEVTFQDRRHAEWALWQLATNAEAVSPPWLRTACGTAPPPSPPATNR